MSVGRNPDEITLIAVSKTVPAELIREAYELGIRDFGESRLQETILKLPHLPNDIRWHFIGKLQSNKAKQIARHFDVIHSLASRSALTELEKVDQIICAFIEINIANEIEKSGIFPNSLDEFVSEVIECSQVHFCGLMTIGPNLIDKEQMRGYFRDLRFLNQKVGGKSLSMGMSGDFEVAIQEGATHVRIGSALFGARSDIQPNQQNHGRLHDSG